MTFLLHQGRRRSSCEGDFDGLVKCMGHVIAVKDRQATTDEMFEPLKQTIELLHQYGQELSDEVHQQLQEFRNSGKTQRRRVSQRSSRWRHCRPTKWPTSARSQPTSTCDNTSSARNSARFFLSSTSARLLKKSWIKVRTRSIDKTQQQPVRLTSNGIFLF